jgi:hypothetical protein
VSALCSFKGYRGYRARQYVRQLTCTSTAYAHDCKQFFTHIEDINQRAIESLAILNDRLPGLIFDIR